MADNTQIRFKYGERENAIEIVKPEGYEKQYPNLWILTYDDVILEIDDINHDLQDFLTDFGNQVIDKSETSFDFVKKFIDHGMPVTSINVYDTELEDDFNTRTGYDNFENLMELTTEVPLTYVPTIRYKTATVGYECGLEHSADEKDKQKPYLSIFNSKYNEPNALDNEKQVCHFKYNPKTNTFYDDYVNLSEKDKNSDTAIITASIARGAFDTYVGNIEKNKELERTKEYARHQKKLKTFMQEQLERLVNGAANKFYSYQDKKHKSEMEKINDNIKNLEDELKNLKDEASSKESAWKSKVASRVFKNVTSSKKIKRHNDPDVNVEMKKNENGVPVISIVRNKNGVIEELNIEYNGKSLSKSSELYKQLMETKSPSDVMVVLHKNKIGVEKMDISLESNLPSLVPQLSKVLQNSLKTFGYDGNANIKVKSKSNDIEFGTELNLENGDVTNWNFKEVNTKTNTKSEYNIDKDLTVKSDIDDTSKFLKNSIDYIFDEMSGTKAEKSDDKDKEADKDTEKKPDKETSKTKDSASDKDLEGSGEVVVNEKESADKAGKEDKEYKEDKENNNTKEDKDITENDTKEELSLTDEQKNYIVKDFMKQVKNNAKDIADKNNITQLSFYARDDFSEQLKNDVKADPVFSKMAVEFLNSQDFDISEKLNKANITKDMYAKTVKEFSGFAQIESSAKLYDTVSSMMSYAKEKMPSENDVERAVETVRQKMIDNLDITMDKYTGLVENPTFTKISDPDNPENSHTIPVNRVNVAKIETVREISNICQELVDNVDVSDTVSNVPGNNIDEALQKHYEDMLEDNVRNAIKNDVISSMNKLEITKLDMDNGKSTASLDVRKIISLGEEQEKYVEDKAMEASLAESYGEPEPIDYNDGNVDFPEGF
jgi:hypothetical protein